MTETAKEEGPSVDVNEETRQKSDPRSRIREIGSIFNLSRERIRQIKERAIERLRHVSRARRLEPYH